MKVKELKKYLSRVPDDFTVTGMIISSIPEEELNKRSYKYPNDLISCKIEEGDIGYSDKVLRLDFVIDE